MFPLILSILFSFCFLLSGDWHKEGGASDFSRETSLQQEGDMNSNVSNAGALIPVHNRTEQKKWRKESPKMLHEAWLPPLKLACSRKHQSSLWGRR
jgi:hypothetical protein